MRHTTGLRTMARGGLLLACFAVAACQTDQQFLDGPQPAAIDTALQRAKFELNCEQLEPTVLSRDIVQAGLAGPRFGGFPRAEYTIGVSGCGQRETYVVVCADEDECFAGDGR